VIKVTNRQKNEYTSRTNGTFGFARLSNQPFAKPKEPFFANAHKTVNSLKIQ
jgi:hypothetical protein